MSYITTLDAVDVSNQYRWPISVVVVTAAQVVRII